MEAELVSQVSQYPQLPPEFAELERELDRFYAAWEDGNAGAEAVLKRGSDLVDAWATVKERVK